MLEDIDHRRQCLAEAQFGETEERLAGLYLIPDELELLFLFEDLEVDFADGGGQDEAGALPVSDGSSLFEALVIGGTPEPPPDVDLPVEERTERCRAL